MGVITKPDLLPAGSGSEANFLELARNENVVFSLGWHVIKNRKFEEKHLSIEERNISEAHFFNTSKFQTLPDENVGINSLRVKLSQLLFEHVKNELLRLQSDLEKALKSAQHEKELLGKPRSSIPECRSFLGEMSLKFYELCRAGVNGHYEHDWFKIVKMPDNSGVLKTKTADDAISKIPSQRIRAIVQGENRAFGEDIRKKGHKYHLDFQVLVDANSWKRSGRPIIVTEAEALAWVKNTLQRSRGTELLGNFNSNVIAELFWEQSEEWEEMSKIHIQKVSKHCEDFVSALMDYIAPKNVKDRIW